MTLTVTHSSHTSASGIAGGLPGIETKGQDAGNIFASLLSTLFALTAPTDGQAITLPETATKTLEGSDAAALSALTTQLQSALGKSATKTTETPQTPLTETPTLDELVAGLVETLRALGVAVEAGENLDPKTLARAADAIEAVSRLLSDVKSALAPSTTGNVAAATPANATLDGTTRTPQESQSTPLPRAIAELAQLADKLTTPAPDLSARLTRLTEQLQQLTAPSAQPTAQTAASDEDSLKQLLTTLIGERQLTGQKANTPPSATRPETGTLAPKIQLSSLDAPKLDITDTKIVTEPARPTPTSTPARSDTPATNLAASAASNAATAAPKTERSPQTDPLLIAQNGGVLAAKPDSALAIKPATAAYQAQSQTPNLPNIAFEIARQHAAGVSKFQIRMDPPEMGKIDVRLNVDNSGNLHARLTVERAETLDLLQRDARTLEKALQQAGLENRSTNLEFSLRQNPFARQDGQFGGGQNSDAPLFSLSDEAETPIVEMPPPNYYRGIASPGGINMFA